MIDLALLIILALVAWNVAAEGAWGAAAVFFSVLFSALVATNYFEPLADLLQAGMGTDWAYRVDFIALVGLFAGGVFGLRYLSEWLVPNFIVVNGRFYDACRWVFGVLTGYVTIGFLLMAMHTAPSAARLSRLHPRAQQFLRAIGPRSRLARLRAIRLRESRCPRRKRAASSTGRSSGCRAIPMKCGRHLFSAMPRAARTLAAVRSRSHLLRSRRQRKVAAAATTHSPRDRRGFDPAGTGTSRVARSVGV